VTFQPWFLDQQPQLDRLIVWIADYHDPESAIHP